MKEKCKNCEIRYYPTCKSCKDWFAPIMCDGCGFRVCGGNMQFVEVPYETVRDKFFVKDEHRFYQLCYKCYKTKYLGEENAE